MKSTTKIIVAAMVTAIMLGSAQQAAELLLRKRKNGLIDTNKNPSPTPFSSRTLEECNVQNQGGMIICGSASGKSCAGYEIKGCGPVSCVDESACEGATMNDSSVFCQESSCVNTTIHNSNVTCTGFDSCDSARIYHSRVVCSEDYGLACSLVQFTASAVSCPLFQSCEYATFDECSCCDGIDSHCPEFQSVPKCQVNGSYEEFCSSLYNGVSCAVWGNPICAGMPGFPSNPPRSPLEPTRDTKSPLTSKEPMTETPTEPMTEIPTEATTGSNASATLVPANEQDESLEPTRDTPSPLTPKEPMTEIPTEATAGSAASATLVPANEQGESSPEIQWEIWAPVIAAVVAAVGAVAVAVLNRQRKVTLLVDSNTTK